MCRCGRVTQMMRLSYEEMFFVGLFLDMVVKEHPNPKDAPIRMQLGISARKKIWSALEQAERDGKIDVKKFESMIGKRDTDINRTEVSE